ncbi:MAG: DUF262 domain-containing protein [Thermoplasmata archaeon]|nr:DUF262 domain-containing protein [Thermoplasmata archaeon]
MSETVFAKVDYDLGSLVKKIELGEIGLPDIQRPFIWKNAKVRDLFDSMYRGYPVGYLLLWRNGLDSDRTIGTDTKQKSPRLVIVDGQQRLTSLYAVVKGISVVRENYESERVCIAFNPLDGRFEVADAAIQRDKAFIPDISRIWSGGENIFKIANAYIDGLKGSREVSDEDVEKIQNAITKLLGLLTFPFTALELEATISEEDVSDVFVRINSKGTPLNQADFILTLMSVFWDEGRAEMERFCREARKPTKGEASPFNYFIEPAPDQLLRVSVGVAFKRARLRYVYSILRGKDMETEQFSNERRVEQFEKLKTAQALTLNIQYWHDFLSCIRMAGFRSGKMISSQNNLLFSYMLYLIGRTEIGVDVFTLRKAIAQWFFMSAVTGRFTNSPESKMEFDLARLCEATSPEDFIHRLQHICNVTLTNDFWGVALPNDLATSSPRSPSLFAYNAALVLLDAHVLFSHAKMAELLDPALHANRAAIERHHLFPKSYLEKLQITGIRETNQIGNYAYVEWSDNMRIADTAPVEYLPELKERFSALDLTNMYHCHALPDNWERMEYQEFLENRRELMASVIREGYQKLTSGARVDETYDVIDIASVIDEGDPNSVESRSTLRINLHTGEPDRRIETAVLKTLAGFMNTNGGTMIVGVSDDGASLGVDEDLFSDEESMIMYLESLVRERMGLNVMTSIHAHFEDLNGVRILLIRCSRSRKPVFVKDGDKEHFFIRTGPSTTELSIEQAKDYIERWAN